MNMSMVSLLQFAILCTLVIMFGLVVLYFLAVLKPKRNKTDNSIKDDNDPITRL